MRVAGLGRRKRSRSPPVGIPRLRRFARKGSPSGSGSWSSAPESFRIFYRTSGSDDEKAFALTLPSHVLEPFSLVDVSRDDLPEHDRLHLTRSGSLSSLQIYPDYYAALPSFPDGIPLGSAAVIGSTLYALLCGGHHDVPGKLMSLNLDYPHAQSWKQILPGPRFLEPGCPIKQPKLVSLRGRLYLFCSRKPFGQVYNPRSKSWSVLPEPPEIVDSSKCNMVLRTSLGESHGKILVYGCNDVTDRKSNAHFHVYDVDSGRWTSSPSTFEVDANPLQEITMLGKAVVKEEDPNSTILYFMDECGLIYALDWLNKEIFCGPIVGMESEDLVNRLKSCHYYNTFFHIWGDLFCFLWTTRTRPDEDYKYSHHHFTFLRLVNNSKPDDLGCSLTAYVVGCLQDTVDNYYKCYDALLV